MATVVVHCGAGSTPSVQDAAEAAAERGAQVLREGGSALDAVVEAVVLLEDDERLNAGTGARMNLEGEVEMDASLMTSDLRCGAVAALRDVKNPIRVAREVMESPHVLLAGEGALRFARRRGIPPFDPATPRARRILEDARRKLETGDVPRWAPGWKEYASGDTVGAVARDDADGMAAANSTGGTILKLPGRVGDTPLIGCGLYAGPRGGVTATGVGEEIVRRVLCKTVYDALAERTPQEACDEGVALFPEDVPVGILAVAPRGWGASANTKMAWHRGTG